MPPGFVDVQDHLMGDLRDGQLGVAVPGSKGPLIVGTVKAGTCEGKGLQGWCTIAVGGYKGIRDMKDSAMFGSLLYTLMLYRDSYTAIVGALAGLMDLVLGVLNGGKSHSSSEYSMEMRMYCLWSTQQRQR